MATLQDETVPLDPTVVEEILEVWQNHRPADAVALARRWLSAKCDGVLSDDDVAILMAICLGYTRIPDAKARFERLVRAGWCRLPE